jgi:hypothetical protein
MLFARRGLTRLRDWMDRREISASPGRQIETDQNSAGRSSCTVVDFGRAPTCKARVRLIASLCAGQLKPAKRRYAAEGRGESTRPCRLNGLPPRRNPDAARPAARHGVQYKPAEPRTREPARLMPSWSARTNTLHRFIRLEFLLAAYGY